MSTTTLPFDYEIAIVGGGSAGYAAARVATEKGLRTVVVEGAAEIGGLCILRGCMPTKMLLHASEVLHHTQHAESFGISCENVSFNFSQVMSRKDEFINDLANERREQLAHGQFTFIQSTAKFLDPHTIHLGDHRSLTAAHFVITTGSSIAPSHLPGLNDVGYLTSDDALKLTQVPKSLIILGGGPVAVEFAQLFARFGVHVTILQRGDHLLSKFDTDAAVVVEKVFRREGIEIFTNAELLEASHDGSEKTISFSHHGRLNSVSASEIMLALGRVPNTTSLDLDKAGVTTENGRIVVNEFMQTCVPHIYSAGDCTKSQDVVHLAVRQGEIAAHNIAHSDSLLKLDERLSLTVIFIEPQVAVVGLTEKTAKTHGVAFLTASYPFCDHGKSIIMHALDGHVKLLADPLSGEILGGACVGPYGGELIHEIVVAIAKHMTVHELASLPHYHPTLSEIWTYPAQTLADQISAPQ